MEQDVVTIQHPAYVKASKDRIVFEDVCAGTSVLRIEDKAKVYLPQFPKERQTDYDFRRNTATLFNITQKTVDTFCGLVFQKDIALDNDVPTEIAGTDTQAGLIENIDNKGNHINVFARSLFEDSFEGCAGVLVDAPTVTANDLGQQRALGLRPYWVAYCARDIINWDYQVNETSKKLELSLVVLREGVTKRVGKFIRKSETQYRVLRMEVPGKPTWELWTQVGEPDASGKVDFARTQEGTFGKQTRIPFAIVGELGQCPPLMDLTFKNLEHFQTYSDYKSIIHKTCVPMLWTAGLDGNAPDNIGGSSWWKLTENGKMGFAEVQGASIEKTRIALEDIKTDMAWLGLQMLMPKPKGSKATATEVVSDQIQDTSALQVMATQLKDAIELALGFTAQYLGKGEDAGGSIELGAKWSDLVLPPEEMQAYSGLVDSGQMSLKSFLWIMQKAGKLPPDVDPEEEMKQIEEEMKSNAGIKPVVNALNNGNPATGQPAPPAAAQAA